MSAPFLWRGAWYVNYVKPDGKRSKKLLDKNKAKAMDKWKLMSSPTSNPTVASVADKYVGQLKTRVAISSVSEGYMLKVKGCYEAFLKGRARMRWDAFTLDTVYDHANREAWSNDTKRTRMTALKTLSNYGAKTFGLKDNLIGLQLPTKRRREKHVTREEYNQLVDGVFACNRKSTYGFAMFLAVLWHTGARPGELMSAEVSQFDGSRIVLTKHKNERKSEKPRVIYLTPPAVVAVKMSIDGRGAGKIFCDSRGNPLRKDSLRNRLNRILKAQNMDMSIVAYSFRHGYATRALEAGVDVATLAELMGTSVEMIGKNYGHLDARRDFLAQKAMMVR